jgi:uncharacterized OB-fold protein
MEYKLTFCGFRDGLKAGKLLGLKCNDCGAITCPPRKVCAECGSENQEIVTLKGTGEIKTFTVIYVAPIGYQPPFVVAMAELPEGCRVMGNVIDVEPTKVGMELIGKKVSISYKDVPADSMSAGERMAMTFKLAS